MKKTHSDLPSLDHLVVLEVLLRTRSPRVAASELGVTPSAVSKSLASLRLELADELLVRRGDRMVPTPKGARLETRLASVVRAARAALDDREESRGPLAVHVAMRDQFVVVLGAKLVRILRAPPRDTELRVLAYNRATVAQQLAGGGLDAAIAVDPPDAPGLRRRVLYRESFVCLCPQPRAPTMAEFLDARHVVTTAAGYAGVDAVLSRLGHRRHIAARVPYFAGAVQLADADGLFLTLPSRLAAACPLRRLRPHKLPFAVPGFAVSLVWDARTDMDEMHRDLRRAIVDSARGWPV